jgi:hypothetical protein
VVRDIVDKNTYEEQPYNIDTRRQIKASIKYGYIDLVNFILNVTENLDDHEPCYYKKVISCKKSS